MKKAMLEQLMLGFLLLTTFTLFVATVYDEKNTRDRIYELKQIAKEASIAMARYYEQQIDMCTAEAIAIDILSQTPTGRYLLNNNLISFQWKNITPDYNNDGVGDDRNPDQVTTTIRSHPYSTFWYKFFGLNQFQIGTITDTEFVNTPRNVDIWYGGESAGYTNMIGTYQLDENNCVTNTKLILANSDDYSKIGQKIGSTIQSPPTFIFLMPNGFQKFQNKGYTPGDNDILNLSNHCFGSKNQPTISIGGTTLNSDGRIYFEQTELNSDSYEHIQIIPNNLWDHYNDFVNGSGDFKGNGTKTYNQFLSYCQTSQFTDYKNEINNDGNNNNDIIDCKTDINDEYQYAMEDLDNGGDEDFNDIFLNTTRVIPDSLIDFETDANGNVSLTCDNNDKPIVSLEVCPATINEDTSLTITYSASDSNGTVVSTDSSANHGSTVKNGDATSGTIEYTPEANFFGEDTITVQSTDNSSGSGYGYCVVNVLEVNDPPVISGSPLTTVNINQAYSFTPTASDPDNDPLTFTIENKPQWASFSSSTGALTGTPSDSDVGTYANITITVSDGRGGSDSLTFNVEVVSDNLPPVVVTPIPDHETQENELYTYDVSSHFEDPNGDTLTYSIVGATYVNYINPTSGIISVNIPDNTAGESISITIMATDPDGLSVTDTYILTITNGGYPFFLHTFDSDDEGWNGDAQEEWINDNGEGKLRLTTTKKKKEREASYIFNFTNKYKYKNVKVEFDMEYTGGWETSGGSQDFFYVDLNNQRVLKESPGKNSGSKKYIFTTVTDANGNIKVSLGLDVTDTAEIVKIDNVKVSIIK